MHPRANPQIGDGVRQWCVLSVIKLAGTDQRYFLDQAGVRVDRIESLSSGIEDYYLAGPEAAGEWVGSGAASLGLGRAVDEKALRSVLTQHDPRTGRQLPGPASRARVPGYDFMFSVPKSASIVFGLGDPVAQRAVLRAHDRAVAAALAYLERYACNSRRGKGGAEIVAGAGFVGAAFRHRTSRAGDPQIHTHVLITNATQRPDGQWGTLDGRAIFAEARTAGYVHEAVFRRELTRELGVEWGMVTKGIADIGGVPRAVIRAFSTRRAEVEAKIAEWGTDGLAARQAAAQITRARKDYDVTPSMLVPEWRRKAGELGLSADFVARLTDQAEVRDISEAVRDDVVSFVLEPISLTAQRSTFDRRDVMRAVAARRSGASLKELEALCDAVLDHPSVVPLPAARAATITRRDGRRVIAGQALRYTTTEMLAVELEVLDGVAARREAQVGIARAQAIGHAVSRRHSLGSDQAAMVRHLCGGGAGVAVVVGPPGTGKTFALDAAREAWQASGFAVQGAAVARRAARALQDGAGIDSTSVAALLKDLDASRGRGLDAQTVLVIDEAGMVGTRQLATLLRHAERAEAKVVLVGDANQLPEIGAGGVFAELSHAPNAVSLEVNRRQQRPHDRELLELWRAGAVADAVDLAVTHGDLVMASNGEDTRGALVDEFVRAHTEGADAVMIALRRSDVRDLNERARERLGASGLLGLDQLVLGWGEFAVGDRVVCKRNDHRLEVANGDFGTVQSVEPAAGAMTVRFADRDVRLDPAYLHGGNDAGVLHGYASTAHALQGATVDRAFVLGSTIAYREWGYTAWSRARESTRYFVCEPDIAEERHDVHASDRAPEVDDVVKTLSVSRAQELASPTASGADLDRVRALAARHVSTPYVEAAMGARPAEPRAATRWDRGVLLLERARTGLGIDDPDRPLGREPEVVAPDASPWRRARRLIEDARRNIQRGSDRDRGIDR